MASAYSVPTWAIILSVMMHGAVAAYLARAMVNAIVDYIENLPHTPRHSQRRAPMTEKSPRERLRALVTRECPTPAEGSPQDMRLRELHMLENRARAAGLLDERGPRA